MKIRNDFVSNSSSSSFVILGKIYSNEEVIIPKVVGDELYEKYTNEEIDAYEVFDIIEDKVRKLGLTIEYAGYDGEMNEFCIGLDPDKIKDSDVLGNVKDTVVERIMKFGLNASKREIRFVSGGSEASGLSYFEGCG